MTDRHDPLDERLDAALGRTADAGLDPAAQGRIEAALDARLSESLPGRRRSWLARHALLTTVGGLIAAGSVATAASLVLRGDPSPPTSGTIPRFPLERRLGDVRYRITVTPELTVGQPGWCSSLQFRAKGETRWFGGSGCGYLLHKTGLIGGGTTGLGHGRGVFAYRIVDRTVASALTTDEPVRRILPVSDPAFPNGWRAIIQLPGESHTGNLRFRDRDGRRISTRPEPGTPPGLVTPQAALGPVPASAPCGVTLPADATVRGSRWLDAVPNIPGLSGRGVQACLQTRFQIDDEWAEATVLLDAAKPAERAPLDIRRGGRPVPGLAGAVDRELVTFELSYRLDPAGTGGVRIPVGVPQDALSTIVARKNAWLVIRAKSAALRHRLARDVGVEMR